MFDEGLHPPGSQNRPPLYEQLKLACAGQPKAWRLAEALVEDPDFLTTLEAANALVVNRMGFSDHGRTHALIVATNALTLLDAGLTLGWEPSFGKKGTSDFTDSAVITVLGALMHDLGNSIVRERHWDFSVHLARPLLERLLMRAYRPPVRPKMILNILEVIQSHDSAVNSYSLEGSIVKLADAMDCEGGRSRLPPSAKNPDKRFHDSSQAIDFVHLGPIAKGKPLPVWAELNDKAGLFQLQEIWARRLNTGVLGEKVALEAFMDGKRIWNYPK